MSRLLLLILAACGSPAPVISGVDPAEALPGDTVKVMGENFGEGVSVTIAGQPATTRALGPVLLEVDLPEGVEPGETQLVVTVGDQSSSQAFTVAEVKEDVPCAGAYTANTQLSLAREVVVIDKFFKDETRETLRIPIGEISQVEYELIAKDTDKPCSVIFVRTEDGQRHMFDDDHDVDLKERAYSMARDMGKKVSVTREDAPSLADAKGEGEAAE